MTDEATGRWLPSGFGAGSADCLLFCLPHGGGGASGFRQWKADLAPRIEVVPVHLPGRESRSAEPPVTSVDAVVAALVEPLAGYAGAPFAFFGHSLGALLSYEIAAALTDRGRPPVHLFASGHHPPHLPAPTPAVHGLPDQEFIERLADLGGMPPELLDDAVMMEYLMPRLRADFKICETYRPVSRPPLPVPMTVFAGRDDPAVEVAELGRWGESTTAGVEVHLLDGGHFCHTGSNEPLVRQIVADSLSGIRRL